MPPLSVRRAHGDEIHLLQLCEGFVGLDYPPSPHVMSLVLPFSGLVCFSLIFKFLVELGEPLR